MHLNILPSLMYTLGVEVNQEYLPLSDPKMTKLYVYNEAKVKKDKPLSKLLPSKVKPAEYELKLNKLFTEVSNLASF